jgi:hypothetical protein
VSIKGVTSDSRGLEQLMMAMMPFSGCGVCHDLKLLLADVLLVTGVHRTYKCTRNRNNECIEYKVELSNSI